MPSALHNEVYLRARKRKILYERHCSYVCSHINNERESDDARSPIPFTHSTKHNAAHKSQAQRCEREIMIQLLSRVILRGLDSPFFFVGGRIRFSIFY
jgi:hypothetical protein